MIRRSNVMHRLTCERDWKSEQRVKIRGHLPTQFARLSLVHGPMFSRISPSFARFVLVTRVALSKRYAVRQSITFELPVVNFLTELGGASNLATENIEILTVSEAET